jgi:hypothetical protein
MRASPTITFGGFSGASTIVSVLAVGNFTPSGISTVLAGQDYGYMLVTGSGPAGTGGAFVTCVFGNIAFASAEL